jgi:hypothetical protein
MSAAKADEAPRPITLRTFDLRSPRAGAIQLSYRLHVAIAISVLLLIGAYLRIVPALCAAVAWVREKFNESRGRMPEGGRKNLWR